MEIAILWLRGIEQEERINKQRQVVDQRDIKGAVLLKDLRIHLKEVAKVYPDHVAPLSETFPLHASTGPLDQRAGA
jgi:hypothetical protein